MSLLSPFESHDSGGSQKWSRYFLGQGDSVASVLVPSMCLNKMLTYLLFLRAEWSRFSWYLLGCPKLLHDFVSGCKTSGDFEADGWVRRVRIFLAGSYSTNGPSKDGFLGSDAAVVRPFFP